VQNKPNFPPRGALAGANRAKRTQFLDCGLGPDLRRDTPWGLPPRPRRANRAKRSQFAGAVSGPGWADCAKRTQFGEWTGWTRGPVVQTKPVSRHGLSCERKPISPSRARAGANRAKRTQFRQPGRGLGDEGQTCKTNPILSGQDTPSFHYSIIPPFQSDADCAERTQFPGGAGWDGAWGTRGKRAKRTQFPLAPGGTRPKGRGTRGNRAKRSQFRQPGWGRRCEGRPSGPRYPIIPPFPHSRIPLPPRPRQAYRAKRTQFPAQVLTPGRPGSLRGRRRVCSRSPSPSGAPCRAVGSGRDDS